MALEKYSPFRRGADDGFLFGIYLTVLFFATASATSVPYIGLLSPLMAAGVPIVTYIYLRRSYVKDYGTTQFSSLWMQGIVMFFCGSIIMALAAYIYMRWIAPDFLISQITSSIETLKGQGRGKEVIDILQKMLDNNLIPTPIQVAIEMIWLGVFSGSLLSIIVSLIVQAHKVNT
ncbi:MAG: DUF4199 domain-containing protein [Muribaculaceae bacterium]|nr:DUF4199 domain-containing protein [Muribaculaceae bacterium]